MTLDTTWAPILDVWRSGQVGLAAVDRWSKYQDDAEVSVRPQDSLQHSYSLAILGVIVCHQLRTYFTMEEGLLHRAFLIHDHGEGELGYDTLYIDKTEAGDIAEYEAFVRRYSLLPPRLFGEFHRAFLLQFALKKPSAFPEAAQAVMTNLVKARRRECHVFDAVERLDYVVYAWEQQRLLANDRILVQVLRNQVPHLDRLAETIPGFRQEFWTPELREYFHKFLAVHEGKWIEQKAR